MVRLHGAGTPGQQLAAASAHQNRVKVLSISQGTPPRNYKSWLTFFRSVPGFSVFFLSFLFFSSLLGKGIHPRTDISLHLPKWSVFFFSNTCFSWFVFHFGFSFFELLQFSPCLSFFLIPTYTEFPGIIRYLCLFLVISPFAFSQKFPPFPLVNTAF